MSAGYCLNHPDRQTNIRCRTCHKPVCGQCAVAGPGGPFCSTACRENYARYAGRCGEEPKESIFANFGSCVVAVLALLVIAIILTVIGAKVLNIGFCKSLLNSVGL